MKLGRVSGRARVLVLAALVTFSGASTGWSAAGAPASGTGGSGPFGWRIVSLPAAGGGHRAGFGEPGIAVGQHGLLLINAAQANVGFPTWWVSRNDGGGWGLGQDYDRSGAMTGDADAAIGPDGYRYALNLAFQNPPQQPVNPTILVYSSTDGQHWDGPASFPAPHGADQPDRPWLVPDPYQPNRVFVTNSEGVGDVVIWASTDHARTFTGPALITGAGHGASIELTSRPLFDPTYHNRMYLLYEASAPADSSPVAAEQPLRDFPLTQLWLAESTNAGRSWNSRMLLDITSAFGPAGGGGSLGHVLPAFAIDRAGTLDAAFSLRLGASTQTHIFLIHSTDHGAHWSRPLRADPSRWGSNVMPALAAGARGRLDISWYASGSPDFTDQHSRWVEMFAQSLNMLSAHPTFTTAQVSGVTHIGSIDTSGNPGSKLYNWGLRDFQSLVIDACGAAHLAWTDDIGSGSTYTARQTSGPSLLPDSGCRVPGR
ncbi:MAG TPA: sialidase family protein [Mycobacteriales bacterium]|nr:sialidase family protein [Mycobacteriales bacterium]